MAEGCLAEGCPIFDEWDHENDMPKGLLPCPNGHVNQPCPEPGSHRHDPYYHRAKERHPNAEPTP
jgi:hypothetical protein